MRAALVLPAALAVAASLAGCSGSASHAGSAPSDAGSGTTSAPARTPTPSGTPDPQCRQPTSVPATAASYAATRLFSLSWQTIASQLPLTQPLLSTRFFPTYQTEIQNLQSRLVSTKTVESFAVQSVTYVSGDCTVPVYRVIGVQTSHQGSGPSATSTITMKEAMLLQGAQYVVDDVQAGD